MLLQGAIVGGLKMIKPHQSESPERAPWRGPLLRFLSLLFGECEGCLAGSP